MKKLLIVVGLFPLLCNGMKNENHFARLAIEKVLATAQNEQEINDFLTDGRYSSFRPLYLAALSDDYNDLVEKLLERGADPFATCFGRRNAWQMTIFNLLTNQNDPVATKNLKSIIAYLRKKYPYAKYLECIHTPTSLDGTLLHDASWDAMLDAMIILLEAGADPNAINEEGKVPLSGVIHHVGYGTRSYSTLAIGEAKYYSLKNAMKLLSLYGAYLIQTMIDVERERQADDFNLSAPLMEDFNQFLEQLRVAIEKGQQFKLLHKDSNSFISYLPKELIEIAHHHVMASEIHDIEKNEPEDRKLFKSLKKNDSMAVS